MNWDFLPQRSLENPKKHANNTSKPHEAAKITVISLIHVLVCDSKTCFILVASIVWEHLFLNRSHMFRHSQHLGSCQNLVHQVIVLRIWLRLFKRWIVLAIHWINYHSVDVIWWIAVYNFWATRAYTIHLLISMKPNLKNQLVCISHGGNPTIINRWNIKLTLFLYTCNFLHLIIK